MQKKCEFCKQTKPLSEYFTATYSGRVADHGTSRYCKQCHNEGKIKHGYGWYGDKYRSPDSM